MVSMSGPLPYHFIELRARLPCLSVTLPHLQKDKDL